MKAKWPNIGLIFGLLLSLANAKCQKSGNAELRCQFRTLNDLNETDFEVKEARNLKISCTEPQSESILRTNHLGYLPHLKHLHIEGCLVKKVPSLAFSGLSGLHELNFVQNGGQSEEVKIILEVETDAFTGLNDLRGLNFSGNNLWSLPKGIFCSLDNLIELDLSRNFIQDASDLGFSSEALNSCRIPLRNLDLSYNSLSR